MYIVQYYQKINGEAPAEAFVASLPQGPLGKLGRWVGLLKQLGPDLPRPYADVVRGKIRELRVAFGGNQYRMLYFFDKRKIILTHGFIKKSDEIPFQEIQLAEKFMHDYFIRVSMQKDGDA